jgi:acyl-coenzyme A thioesterase PaaI-like protein
MSELGLPLDAARVRVAQLMRELGHAFVGNEIPTDDLQVMIAGLEELVRATENRAPRARRTTSQVAAQYKMEIPEEGRHVRHQLFSDSVVSGAANPLGLGAELWREGNHAFMEVTLGKAFEGAPGRSHGGVVAALIDETMGLANAINHTLAFTGQLNITYLAPTPVLRPITAEAWQRSVDGRKVWLDCEVRDGDTVVVKAESLFISVDPTHFLAGIVADD